MQSEMPNYANNNNNARLNFITSLSNVPSVCYYTVFMNMLGKIEYLKDVRGQCTVG